METGKTVKISVRQRLKAPGRKSDLIFAAVLVLLFISFEISNRSLAEVIEHLVFALGFLWVYLQYMKPADHAMDLISDALRKHGDALPAGTTDPLMAAEAAKDRLDRYERQVAETLLERQQMQDLRLKEFSEAHQDLLTHHRTTKKMLQSFLAEEVYEALLKGVRDGFGFHGAVLGMRDRDGYLVFMEDSGLEGRSVARIPLWNGNSLLARTFWSGNQLLFQRIDLQVHVPDDRNVIGEGPAFLLPVSRKSDLQCSDVKNCGNIGCSSYLVKNPRCWIEHFEDCTAVPPASKEEKRKTCVQCEMFSPVALLVVRRLPDSRKISRETIVPILTLANEASLALEVVDLHENMRKMSITDGLTGLCNHREFYQTLRRELERARRYRHTVSLLIIDVDDFKKFNDRFGHLAGDLALKKISDLLKQCARATDVVARYGGEEFAIILPESTASGALMLAERIKTEIGLHNFLPQVPGEVHLTVSIGIYTAEEGAVTEDQMVGYADEAAYSAKNMGKNRVVVKTHA